MVISVLLVKLTHVYIITYNLPQNVTRNLALCKFCRMEAL